MRPKALCFRVVRPSVHLYVCASGQTHSLYQLAVDLIVSNVKSVMINKQFADVAASVRFGLSVRLPIDTLVAVQSSGAWLWAAAAGASTVSPLTDVVYKPATAQCGPRYPRDAPALAHFFAVVATCYLVPIVVVGVCNSLTLAVVRGHGARMRLHSTAEWPRIRRQQRRIAVTLLLVVASFAVAWTPWVVYAFYVVFADDRHLRPPAVLNPIVSLPTIEQRSRKTSPIFRFVCTCDQCRDPEFQITNTGLTVC